MVKKRASDSFPEVGDFKALKGGLDTLLCNLVLLGRMGYVAS